MKSMDFFRFKSHVSDLSYYVVKILILFAEMQGKQANIVSVSAMLVYIHQNNIAQVFIFERYFFVSIYRAAIPCTYLAVFLVAVLPLCL